MTSKHKRGKSVDKCLFKCRSFIEILWLKWWSHIII